MSPAEPAAGGQSVPRPFYLSIFSLVRDDAPHFRDVLERVEKPLQELGWQRITVCSSMTGMVDERLELYRLPQSAPLLDNLVTLEQLEQLKQESDPHTRRLLDFCRTRRKELTRAMPYDPGVERAPNGDLDHLLYSILELKADQEQSFINAMAQLQDLFREKSWSLVSASRSLTIPQYVVHLWHIKETLTLHHLLEDKRYAVLERFCEGQSHRLLRVSSSQP
jgi:hypothetical protein